MAQEGSVELSMDQLSPASVGRGSDTVTLRAVPAPELVTVMANPMGSTAEIAGSSAVLAMSMAARRTSMESVDFFPTRRSADLLAVLSTGESAAVAEVVPE